MTTCRGARWSQDHTQTASSPPCVCQDSLFAQERAFPHASHARNGHANRDKRVSL
jgi:hypothetical protein